MPFFGGGSDPGTALKQLNTENAYSAPLSDRGTSAWNTAFPILEGEAVNPQGYTPAQKTSMNTATQQSLGGSVAGAVGQGNLTAGRTRNPGSLGAALDASAMGGMKRGSTAALGVEEQSANLAQEKQQNALKELGSLYGTNVEGLGKMMANANQALSQYETAKEHEGSVMGDLGQIAKVGGEFAKAATGMPSLGGNSSGDYSGGTGDVGGDWSPWTG